MIGKPENTFKLVMNQKRTRKFLAISLVTGQSRQVLEMVERVDFFFFFLNQDVSRKREMVQRQVLGGPGRIHCLSSFLMLCPGGEGGAPCS